MRPVVIVGSYTPGLAVIRALGSQGVPVVVLRHDNRDMGHASKWVRKVVDIPHPEVASKLFLETLGDLAKRWPGALLIPASDQTLEAVSRHREKLDTLGYVVAAPTSSAAMTCLYKGDTYSLAHARGVPAPRTVALRAESDVERYADLASFPAVLKPVLSHRFQATFGQKWIPVHSFTEAIAEYRRTRTASLDVILQEHIPGDELCGVNYNAYFWAGEARVEFTAAKIRNSPAKTGSPSVVVSRRIPDVLETGRRMLRALEFDGYANIEFKKDPRDGEYKLMEVNARHNLSAALATHCGINFPWLQYRHLLYGEEPTQVDFTEGVYWIDLTRDMKDSLNYLRRPGYSLERFLRPYKAPHVFAVWCAQDTAPARVRAADTLKMAARRALPRLGPFRRSACPET